MRAPAAAVAGMAVVSSQSLLAPPSHFQGGGPQLPPLRLPQSVDLEKADALKVFVPTVGKDGVAAVEKLTFGPSALLSKVFSEIGDESLDNHQPSYREGVHYSVKAPEQQPAVMMQNHTSPACCSAKFVEHAHFLHSGIFSEPSCNSQIPLPPTPPVPMMPPLPHPPSMPMMSNLACGPSTIGCMEPLPPEPMVYPYSWVFIPLIFLCDQGPYRLNGNAPSLQPSAKPFTTTGQLPPLSDFWSAQALQIPHLQQALPI